MEVTKFGRSVGLEGRMDRQDVLAGIKLILQLHVDLCYHSGDYGTERLVHNITVLDVQIHINIMYRGCSKRNVSSFGRFLLK
jgi:hypothetical protein